MLWLKRISVTLLTIAIVGIAGIFLLAWRSSIDPIDPPSAAQFKQEDIAAGEKLAGAGNCMVCHTVTGGEAYAGGYAMPTPFGTIYSTNITPDPETGIGRWSDAAFIRAMQQGVGPEGQHYFPAFPYTHFTQVADDDLRTIYAYLMTRRPTVAPPRENDLPFPFNIRALQAGWKLLFFDAERFQPDSNKSATVNRGAYLAEGLGHCSACHTPRNALGAEDQQKKYAGALIDGWYAPALTAANAAALPWTGAELFEYLRTGATRFHGVAAGSMSEVVNIGLKKLPNDDIRALAEYFAESAPRGESVNSQAIATALDTTKSASAARQHPAGENLFTNACASCHYNNAANLLADRPELTINSAVTGPNATNLARVIMHGIGRTEGMQNHLMPGFAQALSDNDIVALAEYLHARANTTSPWQDVGATVAKAREQLNDE